MWERKRTKKKRKAVRQIWIARTFWRLLGFSWLVWFSLKVFVPLAWQLVKHWQCASLPLYEVEKNCHRPKNLTRDNRLHYTGQKKCKSSSNLSVGRKSLKSDDFCLMISFWWIVFFALPKLQCTIKALLQS